MIKSKAVNSILMGVLAVSLAASAIYCYQCVKKGRDIRSMGLQAATNQVNMVLLQTLLNDCVAYGEKNPAIKPILESVGLKNAPPSGASPKPAAR